MLVHVSLAQRERLRNPQATAPQHRDQGAYPEAVAVVAGPPHDLHDLFRTRRIGRILHSLVARRASGQEPRRRDGRAPTTGGIHEYQRVRRDQLLSEPLVPSQPRHGNQSSAGTSAAAYPRIDADAMLLLLSPRRAKQQSERWPRQPASRPVVLGSGSADCVRGRQAASASGGGCRTKEWACRKATNARRPSQDRAPVRPPRGKRRPCWTDLIPAKK